MILILFNWLIVTFISYTIGFAVRKIFVPVGNNGDLAITIIWGLFVISIISTLLLFFMPSGVSMFFILILLAMITQFILRQEIGKRLTLFWITVAGKREMIFAALLMFALLIFSAQPSKINDDGYYYTPTVMWFAEAGLVNGISNLLLPLGLGSGWHVLQAVFSFSFLEGIRLNDLNGFLVFIFFTFCLENGFHRKDNLLLALLLAITLLVSIPFLSACSPDLPVIIFTVITFYLLTRPFGSRTFMDILVLAAFAASIKLSAVAVALLAVVLICYAIFRRMPVNVAIYFLLFACAIVVIAKNIYQTGYPFYPYHWLGMPKLSWSTPPEILTHYTAGLKYWGLEEKIYRGPISEWKNPGMFDTVKLLWQRPGYKGWINTFILLSFPLMVLTLLWDVGQRIRANVSQLPVLFLHVIFIINFFVWLTFAPQFRFILPVYIFYVAWTGWKWLKPLAGKKLLDKLPLLPSILILLIFLLSLFPLSLNIQSTSRHIGNLEGFTFKTTFKPHTSFLFPGIDTLRVSDQEYYHVKGNIYCWDSPLPCMSEAYYKFLNDQGYEILAHREGVRWEFGMEGRSWKVKR